MINYYYYVIRHLLTLSRLKHHDTYAVILLIRNTWGMWDIVHASSVCYTSIVPTPGCIKLASFGSLLPQAVAEAARCNSTVMEEDLDRLGSGEYSDYYTTLQSIGKGAFGFVKMGRRNKDDTQVRLIVLFVYCSLCMCGYMCGCVCIYLSLFICFYVCLKMTL